MNEQAQRIACAAIDRYLMDLESTMKSGDLAAAVLEFKDEFSRCDLATADEYFLGTASGLLHEMTRWTDRRLGPVKRADLAEAIKTIERFAAATGARAAA